MPRAARRRPLVWVATAFLLGVAGQGLLPAWAWWALTTVALLLTARKGTFLKTYPFSSGAVLVMVAGLGALTAAADQRVPPHHVAWRVAEGPAPAVVEGLVVNDPIWRAGAGRPTGQQAIIAVTAVGGVPTVGRVWLRHHQPAWPLRYGDRLRVRGTLRPPRPAATPGAFDERRWLWPQSLNGVVEGTRDGVEWVASAQGWRRALRALFDAKHRALGHLQQRVDPLTAALLGALLAGDRTGLPKTVTSAFTDTGTVHLLSVSGWHVTLIGGLLWAAARLVFPRRGAAVATMAALAGYCVLTGAEPPIVRATLAGLVVLGGLCLRRPADPLNTLALAALSIAALAPRTLWTVSFQLSFTSVLALLTLAPIGLAAVRRLLDPLAWPPWADRPVRLMLQSLVVSTACWLGTWPLVAYHLHRICWVAWLANLFAIPLAALVMVTGLVVVLGGALHPWLVLPWVGAVQLAVHGLVAGLAWCAGWPGATLPCPPPPGWGLAVWYLGLAAIARKINGTNILLNNEETP